MKYCVIIADGIADRTYHRIKNSTPIEIARIPAIQSIVSRGRMGIVKTVPDDCPAESLVACMSIFGFDPLMYYTGRASFEALKLGIKLDEKDWIFYADLVSIFEGCIVDSRGGMIREAEASVLMKDLRQHFKDMPVEFYPVQNSHHLLLIRGGGEIEGPVKTYDPFAIAGKRFQDYFPKGKGSEILNQIMQEAHSILSEHEVNKVRRDLEENPADFLWIWSGGKKPTMPSFQENYKLKGAVISASLEIKGLAQSVGLKVVDVQGATGSWDTDYTAKKDAAVKSLGSADIVFLHIRSAIDAAKYSDLTQKVRVLEQIDAKIIGPLLKELGKEYRIMVVGGHFVMAEDGIGRNSPVPFAIYGTNIPGGNSLPFSEKNAAQVDMFIKEGEKLLPFFLKQ